ncbi:hypothetical protein [Nocardia asiatica]|uniref:hypothetical protein n=1 Tax=Nocardia asiatica TaxID=209252 RepID=UPI003EE1DF2B
MATDALLLMKDNLADVIDAKAMMCVHGDAGVGKTLSVNSTHSARSGPGYGVPGAVPGTADTPRYPAHALRRAGDWRSATARTPSSPIMC